MATKTAAELEVVHTLSELTLMEEQPILTNTSLILCPLLDVFASWEYMMYLNS